MKCECCGINRRGDKAAIVRENFGNLVLCPHCYRIKMDTITAIRKLKNIGKNWPKELLLFSDNGKLLVVSTKTSEVLATINGITNDGGDSGIEFIDGKEYS